MAKSTKSGRDKSKSPDDSEATKAEGTPDAGKETAESAPEAPATVDDENELAAASGGTAEGDAAATEDGDAAPNGTGDRSDKGDAPPAAEVVPDEGIAEEDHLEEDTEFDMPPPGVVPAAGSEGGLAGVTMPERARDEDETAPTPSPNVPAPAPAAPAGSDGGARIFPLVLGGVLAGGIGFAAALFAFPEGWRAAPPPPPVDTSRIESLSSELADTGARLETLSEQVAAISDAPPPEPVEMPDLGPLSSRQDAFDGTVADISASMEAVTSELQSLSGDIEALGERVTVLEERPTAPDGSAAMEAQLNAFREELDEVTARAREEIEAAQARAAQIESEAAAAAAEAERRAAIAELRAALDAGEAYAETLGRLPDAPDGLAATAETGVATMAELRRDFPDAARAALVETRAEIGDGSFGDRFMAFLTRRTNARSLAPREGEDVDAILSRAEAALEGGDLDAALTELEALPDAARAAMSGWIDRAETRAAALDAAGALTTAQRG